MRGWRGMLRATGACGTAVVLAACGGSAEEPVGGSGTAGVSGTSGGSSGSAGSGGSSGSKATGGSGGAAGRGGSAGSSGGDGAGGADTGGSGGADTGGSGGTDTGGAGGADTGGTGGTDTGGSGGADTGGSSGSAGSGGMQNPLTDPEQGPPAGNPDGGCDVPDEAWLEDSRMPDRVVGEGTAASCTAQAFIDAVALGGVIKFNCGDRPLTITLTEPAKIYNAASDRVVIDGGGTVTLSGGGSTRILYMNTCDEELGWTTDHCDDQPYPELTLQNITFIDGNSKAEGEEQEGGGGAVWARGGRIKLVNTRFFNNVCADTGPDVGGALRVFSQSERQPVYVVNSTFGGADGFGNTCSNGGGISSIDVSWTIINSVFSHNRAVGNGGNPAESGTPGGGSGGAIYNDGNTITLSICGSLIEHNNVKAYGSAIFFVSNNMMGTLRIHDSTLADNTGGGWNVLPGISMHDTTVQDITNSTIEGMTFP
jgi:hypothetical protein